MATIGHAANNRRQPSRFYFRLQNLLVAMYTIAARCVAACIVMCCWQYFAYNEITHVSHLFILREERKRAAVEQCFCLTVVYSSLCLTCLAINWAWIILDQQRPSPEAPALMQDRQRLVDCGNASTPTASTAICRYAGTFHALPLSVHAFTLLQQANRSGLRHPSAGSCFK